MCFSASREKHESPTSYSEAATQNNHLCSPGGMSRPGTAGSQAGRSSLTRGLLQQKMGKRTRSRPSRGSLGWDLKRHLLVPPNFPPRQEGWIHFGEGHQRPFPAGPGILSLMFRGHLEPPTPSPGRGRDPRGQVPSSREVRLAKRQQVPNPRTGERHPGASPDSESFSSQSM